MSIIESGISRRQFLGATAATAVAAGVVGMTGSKIALADEAAGTYTAGTYTATATGIGEVTVTVTFDETSITEVVLDVSNETETIGQAAADELIEQVLEAQSADIEGVSGATLTSTAVATGVADCIAQASAGAATEEEEATEEEAAEEATEEEAETTEETTSDGTFMANVPSWLGEAPVIDESEISYEEECEILVLGAGNSGVPCALRAAELGADVLVVEPQTYEEYDNYACDMSSYNSETFLNAGAPEYDLTEVYNEYMRKSFSKALPSLVKKWVNKSGEAIDFVVDHVPQDVQDEYMHLCNCPNGPSGFSGESCGSYNFIGMIQWRQLSPNANMWPTVIMNLIDAVEDAGGRYIWGASGVVLEQNDDGDVTGCICQDSDGAYFRVNASKAVVLACGDYGGNSDMLLDLTDEVRNLKWSIGGDRTTTDGVSGMGRDGSGIKMGLWAGGTMEPGPRAPMSSGFSSRPSFPFGGCWPVFGPDGKRFYNEAITKFGNQGVYNHIPAGSLCTTVVDATWREGLEYQDYGHSSMDLSNEYYIGVIEDEMAAYVTGPDGFPVHNYMVYGESTTNVIAADTLEELGGYLGYEGDALQGFLDEIEHYNEMCHNGHDDDWGYDPQLMFPIETPPFFGMATTVAYDSVSAGLVQLAGLNTDWTGTQQVVKGDMTPITGLYATGNCCGNRYGIQYHTPTSGNSCGMAITLGYCLGEELASM